MIILDKPFVSEEIKDYLDNSQTAVLENEMALSEVQGHHMNIVKKDEFIQAYQEGDRLYTLSENSIEWIYQNVPDEKLINCIHSMKNKVEFRQLMKEIYPEFFYMEVALHDLKSLIFATLPVPFVIKPSVGFFSVGVYTVTNKDDWNHAVNEILTNAQEWENSFPGKVVSNATFLLEQYINGDEYAIDVYFDENGKAVILNIMKHDFSSISDVSDRLYYTGKEIIEKKLSDFTDFLNKVNERIQARNFPLHAEVRTEGQRIIPIEFNPMRFAGWCCTDLAYFAFGFTTCDYYFKNKKPDWKTLLKGRENKLYSMIILDKPDNFDTGDTFDYNKICAGFKNVLNVRKLDYEKHPVFGFLFTETDLNDREELDDIVKSDLQEYILRKTRNEGTKL